jgi:hypothetical protein
VNPCFDNDFYTFGQFEYKGKTITRNCDWISRTFLRPNLVKQRRKNWCHRKINGDVVRNQCPTSCDAACLKIDDMSYIFGSFTDPSSGNTIDRTCEWITRKSDLVEQRRKNWCNRKVGKVGNSIQPVYERCPIACDMSCEDNGRFKFGEYTENNGKVIERTCYWITDRLEVADQRRKNWCNRKIDGVVVKDKCVEACNNCCLDVSTYTFGKFKFKGKTVERTCAWITENPKRTAKRRRKWCNKDFNGDGEGALVKDFCRVACKEC